MLLLDEVTANLDTEAQNNLTKTLAELAKNRTIIIVTHTPTLLAACTNIIVLENGKISIGGPAQKVLAHLRNPENETKKSIAKQNNKNERGDSLQ